MPGPSPCRTQAMLGQERGEDAPLRDAGVALDRVGVGAPAQAESMVAALAKMDIPHAYVPFEEEQHGFRRAENFQAALEGELYFYGQIFGFETDASAGPVRIVR